MLPATVVNGIWIIPEMHSYILVILMVAYTFMEQKMVFGE